MENLAEKLYEQALELPIDDRLILIDKLLISTNPPTQEAIDKAWSEEVERRSQELDSGSAKLIPGEEVFEKVKKQFAKCDLIRCQLIGKIDKISAGRLPKTALPLR